MKLLKFKDKKQNNNKNIMIAFGIIISFLVVGYISKSYAIYKLEKKYDIIQTKVGTFPKGDVQVAVLVDGQEASTFPTYEDNYYVESVECTNGVNATFDVENWEIKIADMSSTSTKCTVSFDSHRQNAITPVNMSKTEILALNEEISKTSARTLANYLYPVGSIYLSTEDDTVAKVEAKFGGEWEAFGQGRTLVGMGSNGTDNYTTVEATGGSCTATLAETNLPAHTHSISHTHTTPASTITSSGAHTHSTTAVNNVGSTTTDGNHAHTVYFDQTYYEGKTNHIYGNAGYGYSAYRSVSSSTNGAHSHKLNIPALSIASSGAHTHTVPAMTTNSISTTTSGSTGSGTAFSTQDPYITTYMYKRVS